jgi:TRAP-type C4-dicarboxylate transport system permease small subunit
MGKLESAYGRLLEILALAACALILGMMLMICADVFLRNVRVVPGMVGIEWANEISEAMLYLIALLTAPWLMRRGQHIRVDVLLRAVPPRLGWGLEWLVDLLAMVRGACGAGQLAGRLAVDQDAGHAGVVAAERAAGRVPRAHRRDVVPHAAPLARAARAAR